MLELAHHKGIIAGVNYGLCLLRPGNTTRKPRCPYRFWQPVRALCWSLGLSVGVYHVLHRD